jgi:NitT/TauT family transport system ATP-binding protein
MCEMKFFPENRQVPDNPLPEDAQPSDLELICENLNVTYRSSQMTVEALLRVDFGLAHNEFVCVVGPSGCGKSTLLRAIAGLIPINHGRVIFSNQDAGDKPRCAMVFQEHGLFPWMTVLENVAFGLEMQRVSREKRTQHARHFLSVMGLSDFEAAYPHQLSGGMRQRVGVARAFASGADILLMDEPFRALDAQTRLILQEELMHIWRQNRKTVLYVTHDIEEAILLGDRVLVMSARPAVIQEQVVIDLSRPRDLTGRTHHEVEELKWHIWKSLEPQARQSLLNGR